MTRNYAGSGYSYTLTRQGTSRTAPPLTLRHPAPNEWRYHNPPAYAGDPEMDWESRPEPPPEPRYLRFEAKPSTRRH